MNNRRLLVDGHVHFYEPNIVKVALSAASTNFRCIAQTSEFSVDHGLLLLADSHSSPGFRWASQLPHIDALNPPSDNWQIVSNPDESVIHVARADALPIAILGGQQVISKENLEVLVFPICDFGNESHPIAELISQAVEQGALTILPWGVGKWLGKRGKLISKVLVGEHNARIFVGDNGGRPRIWNHVRELSDARAAGIRNIAGTDPLPVPGEEQRIGTFGVSIQAAVDHTWTSADFVSLLCDGVVKPFGQRMALYDFLKKQFALRMKNDG